MAEWLAQLGVRPGDRVGLWAPNSAEWLFADLGIQAIGGISVPAHDLLPTDAVLKQFTHAGVKVIVTNSTIDDPRYEPVIDVPNDVATGLTPFRFREVTELTESMPWIGDCHLSELATVVYTSGTTGEPKGVMLTHHNLIANTFGAQSAVPFTSEDVVLNWLPFSHIYARSSDAYRCVRAGCLLTLAGAEDVLGECRDVRPTVLRGVPRFFEKVMRVGSLSSLFGDRIRLLFVGGAPLRGDVEEAFRDAGLTLLHGYGLTETSPTATVNRPGEERAGTSGRPVPGCEITIAEDDEILIRGPIVSPGYWNDASATRAAFRDQWLKTGDLGQIDESGCLTITGRKKELIVLSTGKKVFPSLVEERLGSDARIDQVMIVGEGRPYLIALVVPSERGKEFSSVELREHVQRLTSTLAPWERVRGVIILDEPFCLSEGEVTVSHKIRRTVIAHRYGAQIARAYEGG